MTWGWLQQWPGALGTLTPGDVAGIIIFACGFFIGLSIGTVTTWRQA